MENPVGEFIKNTALIFFKITLMAISIKAGKDRKGKIPVRPRSDFFKPMKEHIIIGSSSTLIDAINLDNKDEEVNDDSYLE